MRLLTVNDDVTLPGTVVCAHVTTIATQDELNPNRKLHTFRQVSATAGRIEGGQWTRCKSKSANSTTEFFNWLNFARHNGKPLWLLLHGLATAATALGFWKLLESGEFRLNQQPQKLNPKIRSAQIKFRQLRLQKGLLIDSDPPSAIVCWHRDGWKLVVLDIRNYCDKRLSDIETLCGLPNARVPSEGAPAANWQLFSEQRAAALTEAVRRLTIWHRREELGRFGFSVAGCALAGFRHRFMRHEIHLPENQNDRDLERRAYYTGRTDALWIGKMSGNVCIPAQAAQTQHNLLEPAPRGNFHLVDARSFYGAIMAFCEVPIKEIGRGNDTDELDFPDDIADGTWLANCRVESAVEAFPYRGESFCTYANGNFWTTLCGPELARAANTNSLRCIGEWRRYELAPALQAFALKIWEQREQAGAKGDQFISALCKALLARLHGKFLQRNTRWENVTDVDVPGPWRKWSVGSVGDENYKEYRSIGWDAQLSTPAGDAPHCFPAIAAWVTAWGREWLAGWMRIAGARQVLYVSTDSLIVTDAGRKNLENAGIIWPSGLGSCRVQESSDQIHIRGPNNYTLGSRTCVSGLYLGATQVDGGKWTRTERPRLRSLLASGGPDTIATNDGVQVMPDSTPRGKVELGGWVSPPVFTEVDRSWESKRSLQQATQE